MIAVCGAIPLTVPARIGSGARVSFVAESVAY
jgi:hypothetical protein